MNQHQKEKMLLTTQEIITTIEIKDVAYGSSWKAHGGFSAFFNLDRKYSRVQNMAEEQNFDLFKAMEVHPESGPDALKDLIAYALLTLAETYDPPGWSTIEVEETMPPRRVNLDLDFSGEPGPGYVDQDNGGEE